MSIEAMKQALEAWIRGYFLFRVNGKYFLCYNTAKAARVATQGSVIFDGLHILKGWRCFFIRITVQ